MQARGDVTQSRADALFDHWMILCVEAHMRELLEQGFEVIVVKNATAAAMTPDLGDGYAAAVTNFKFMANALVSTAEAVDAIRKA